MRCWGRGWCQSPGLKVHVLGTVQAGESWGHRVDQSQCWGFNRALGCPPSVQLGLGSS